MRRLRNFRFRQRDRRLRCGRGQAWYRRSLAGRRVSLPGDFLGGSRRRIFRRIRDDAIDGVRQPDWPLRHGSACEEAAHGQGTQGESKAQSSVPSKTHCRQCVPYPFFPSWGAAVGSRLAQQRHRPLRGTVQGVPFGGAQPHGILFRRGSSWWLGVVCWCHRPTFPLMAFAVSLVPSCRFWARCCLAARAKKSLRA